MRLKHIFLCIRELIDYDNYKLSIMKDSPSLKTQVVAACLQNVRNREENKIEKELILNIIKKLPQSQSMIDSLNKTQKDVFFLLLDGYYSFRDAYLYMVSLPEYNKCPKEDFDINLYLLQMIPSIILFEDKLNQDGVISKFNVGLLRNFCEANPKFKKDFIAKWREKAKEKIYQKNRSKEKQILVQEIAAQAKKVEVPKQPTIPQPDQSSEKDSPPQPKPKQKTQQELARQAKERERERQKQIERERQRQRLEKIQKQNQEKRKMQERKQREENQRKSDLRQRENFRNLKGKAIEKYIELRKDLHCQKGKSKDIGEYLAAKLDQFLKTSLEQMYDIACLKNKKNPRFGNELGYFADENDRVQTTQDFYFLPNTKVQSLTYKHKHQIYSNLRIKEIKKEDELRTALQAKTNEGEKKIDKRIENYILKPRPKDTEGMLVPFRQQRDGYRSQGVAISIEHAIYFLQNHPWLKSSLLLFEVYHLY